MTGEIKGEGGRGPSSSSSRNVGHGKDGAPNGGQQQQQQLPRLQEFARRAISLLCNVILFNEERHHRTTSSIKTFAIKWDIGVQ